MKNLAFVFLILFFVPKIPAANRDPLADWAENKRKWAQAKMAEGSTSKRFDAFVDFHFPDKKIRINPSRDESKNALATKQLFHEYFPLNDPASYVGTFFESGHPYVLTKYGPYQWNSLGDSGMDDHEVFRKVIKTLVKEGIKNFRLAPLLHIDNQKLFLEKIRIIWEEGGTPIITIVWFPSFKPWEVKTADGKIDFPKSYILNPQWPKDIGEFTASLMPKIWALAAEIEKTKGKKLTALLNGVNEPETLAGFNRHFWHGAFANWFHPEKLRYYILSIIRIAEANVLIRKAVEQAAGGRKIIFIHNEAMTPDYYPSHQGLGKYAVSKFMLGDESLLKAKFGDWKKSSLAELKLKFSTVKDRNEVESSILRFIFGTRNKSEEDRRKAQSDIVSELERLQQLHLDLQAQTGKTMKTNSILYLDYYYQTEFKPSIPIPRLAKEIASIKRLKEILKVIDDKALFEMIRGAVEKIDHDFAPFGPEGPAFSFNAKSLADINLEILISKNDYLILERLIGLRREYTFVTDPILHQRRMLAGIGDDEKIIFRTDHFMEKVLMDDAKMLKEILKVSSEKQLREKLKLGSEKSLRDALDENGRNLFNTIFGLKREFMIGFEPQHYARQIRAGIRLGFYHFFMEYINSLRLYVVGIGESGTPFYYFANLLHNQVMMEYVSALKNGVHGTQYVFGPAVDTVGWARSPLGHHWKQDHEVNPSGILRIENRGPKFRGNEAIKEQWAVDFMHSVFENMKKR